MEDIFKLRKKFNVKRKNGYSTELVQYLIRKKGGKVKENFKYEHPFKKFYVQCKKNHKWWKICWDKINQNRWCPECGFEQDSIRHKLKNKEIQKFINLIKRKSGKLNKNFKYKDTTSKFFVTCKKGHKWETNYNIIKYGNHWCPYCSGHKKNISLIKKFIKNKGGILYKNWRYQGTFKKFYLKDCGKGHRFETTWDRLNSDKWCPECSRSKSEKEFRKFIENIKRYKFPSSFPKWLRRNRGRLLQLDGYNEKHKMAFEYQGHQHYDKNSYFHKFSKNGKKKSWRLLKESERTKIKKCKEKGISLIIVPYYYPKKLWSKLIKKVN